MASKQTELSWISERDLRELGFTPAGPEEDLGQRWGSEATIRITFAPNSPGADTGYLYAYDAATDRYALLAADTTRAAVEAAMAAVASRPSGTVRYVEFAGALAAADELTPRHAYAIWTHCLNREADLREQFEHLDLASPIRFSAAHAFIVARGARVAAEDLEVQALDPGVCDGGVPVVVRYRVPSRPDWHGRAIGADIGDAAFRIADVAAVIGRYGYQVQATSLTHGHISVAATRVPELQAFTTPTLRPSGGIEL